MVRHAAAVVVGLVLSASPLHAQDTRFTVTAASANVHAGPTTASPVIDTVAWGRTFDVTRELGSWVRVSWPAAPRGAGYLHVTWGKLSRTQAGAPAANAATPQAVRMDVTTAGSSPRPARDTASASASPSASPSASTQIDLQPGQTAPRSPGGAVVIPSHVVGVGGRMGSNSIGFAASGRLWALDLVGIQLELGRATQTSAVVFAAPLRVTTIGSSVVYSLPDLLADAVWVRPYLGAGAGFYRYTVNLTPGAAALVDTGFGYQALGGAEFTWAGLPQLALSADLRHEWAPRAFTGFETGGMGVALSAHWYVK